MPIPKVYGVFWFLFLFFDVFLSFIIDQTRVEAEYATYHPQSLVETRYPSTGERTCVMLTFLSKWLLCFKQAMILFCQARSRNL